PREVQAFVEEHRDWIDRARQHVRTRYLGDRELLPSRIRLRAIDLEVRVRYRKSATGRARSRVVGNELHVETVHADHRDARAVLRAWLLDEARAHLTPRVWREAEAIGRLPEAVQGRLQRTRWGRRSGHGHISPDANSLQLERPHAGY